VSKFAAARADDEAPSAASEAIHASALVVGEAGVLIRGPSGSGKSALTLALLALAENRKLFARLIGDDRVLIHAKNRRILAAGAPNIHGLIERRGYGIVGAQTEACAIVRLIVDLLPPHEPGPRLPEEGALTASLAGIALPRLMFGGRSNPVERAYAVLGCLDKAGDKIITGFAHFA
jgi:serine kinase of HPr protein (carbohydrate metabolism regulator)